MSHDDKLQQQVLEELGWEPSVTSAHIGVAVDNGIVTLTGSVNTFVERSMAEAAAQRVKGVRAVVEEIKVKLPDDARFDDGELATGAADRLDRDVFVPHGAVKVGVENGWITLSGEVSWDYQRRAAEQCVERLPGVTGVSNHIELKPVVNVENIRDDITHALHRSWFFDPQTIVVSAEGGKVRLSGTVKSPAERAVAAATAWSAPGVIDVRNDLTVA
ncbi:BON domain-containing protein [Methylovirgula sp. 4M-Z18]|uniref:BON domain-containing protein n=1 Tax=Methylovirgula sp. 4M-Z18 TaxID=2293567 RepID=UPI000E2F996E|nr:BON domain-containing protein [Methylovirgula sp. 4M-Z18]RFB79805.1 BON domain-containing protein [Methylovirgula sp. 4M-Z18]